MTSVRFDDESIFERSVDNFTNLKETVLKVYPKRRRVSDFDGLVDKPHKDEGLLYNTTRVFVRRGLIVGFRAWSLLGSSRLKIRLLATLQMQSTTEDFAQLLHCT